MYLYTALHLWIAVALGIIATAPVVWLIVRRGWIIRHARWDSISEKQGRKIESLNATIAQQAEDLERAHAVNGQSESQVRHFQKTASELKEDVAALRTQNGKQVKMIGERDEEIKMGKEKYFESNETANTYKKKFAGEKSDHGRLKKAYDKVVAEVAEIQRRKEELEGVETDNRNEIKELEGFLDAQKAEIKAFRGKPTATGKIRAVVRKIGGKGRNAGKFTVALRDEEKNRWEYDRHTVFVTPTAAEQAALKLNTTEVVVEEG